MKRRVCVIAALVAYNLMLGVSFVMAQTAGQTVVDDSSLISAGVFIAAVVGTAGGVWWLANDRAKFNARLLAVETAIATINERETSNHRLLEWLVRKADGDPSLINGNWK